MSLALEEALDALVVGDNAVVNNDESAGVVAALRVRVDSGGDAVRGPAGVRDAHMHVVHRVHAQRVTPGCDLLFQRSHLALPPDELRALVGVAAIDADAGAVVAAVLKALQPRDQVVDDLLPRLGRQVVQVGKDSAHRVGLKNSEKRQLH